jgi:hypothetical protein
MISKCVALVTMMSAAESRQTNTIPGTYDLALCLPQYDGAYFKRNNSARRRRRNHNSRTYCGLGAYADTGTRMRSTVSNPVGGI